MTAAKSQSPAVEEKPVLRLTVEWPEGGTPVYHLEGKWTGKEVRQIIHPSSRMGLFFAYRKRNYDIVRETERNAVIAIALFPLPHALPSRKD